MSCCDDFVVCVKNFPLTQPNPTRSPPKWQIRDGIVRSEVVGFKKPLLDFLFDEQDESVGLPMEYVLRFKGTALYNNKDSVSFFPILELAAGSSNVRDAGGRQVDNL